MTKRISNYTDLMREEEELKLQLQLQRDLIRMDIKEIKEELLPAKPFDAYFKSESLMPERRRSGKTL